MTYPVVHQHRDRLYPIPSLVPAHLLRYPTVYQEHASILSVSKISVYRSAGWRMTHCAAPNITLLQLPEPVSIRVRLIYFSQRDIHEVIAVYEMSVECFSVLQLDQLWGNRVSQFSNLCKTVDPTYHRFVLRCIQK